MRHGLKARKLNVTTKHRKAMFGNMLTNLIVHEQITTTLPKAKELKSLADKMITLGKKGDLASFKKANDTFKNEETVRKLFNVLAKRYEKREGGYTRVLKAGFRFGDCAPIAIIEFVDRDILAKGKADKARHEEMKKAIAATDQNETHSGSKVSNEEKTDMKKSKVSEKTSNTKVTRIQRNEKSK